jgi:hypothetical protein
MTDSKLKHSINVLISSVLVSVLCSFIAWLISKKFNMQFSDVLFYISIIVIVSGSLSMMQGNPSGASISGLGDNNAKSSSYVNLEAIKSQYESADYRKNFKRHSVVELKIKGVALVLGGVILLLYNILFI